MLSLLTIWPVRLTVSPSLTSRSEPKRTTPTWPASKFMHMPLTPEANLGDVSISKVYLVQERNLLDQLLGLNIAHAMDTGDTITVIT